MTPAALAPGEIHRGFTRIMNFIRLNRHGDGGDDTEQSNVDPPRGSVQAQRALHFVGAGPAAPDDSYTERQENQHSTTDYEQIRACHVGNRR